MLISILFVGPFSDGSSMKFKSIGCIEHIGLRGQNGTAETTSQIWTVQGNSWVQDFLGGVRHLPASLSPFNLSQTRAKASRQLRLQL